MSTITDLPDFNRVHKSKRTYKPCPQATIDKYRDRLPSLVVETWSKDGFLEFSEGFLWMVDPGEFRDVVRDLVHEAQSELADVVFRTAFGDLIVHHGGGFVHFSAVTLRSRVLGGTIEAILEMDLGQPRFLKALFFYDLFKKGLRSLGRLSEEEVYGFVPVPALGGQIDPDNLQKTNLRTYLHFLSQLQNPEESA